MGNELASEILRHTWCFEENQSGGSVNLLMLTSMAFLHNSFYSVVGSMSVIPMFLFDVCWNIWNRL